MSDYSTKNQPLLLNRQNKRTRKQCLEEEEQEQAKEKDGGEGGRGGSGGGKFFTQTVKTQIQNKGAKDILNKHGILLNDIFGRDLDY